MLLEFRAGREYDLEKIPNLFISYIKVAKNIPLMIYLFSKTLCIFLIVYFCSSNTLLKWAFVTCHYLLYHVSPSKNLVNSVNPQWWFADEDYNVFNQIEWHQLFWDNLEVIQLAYENKFLNERGELGLKNKDYRLEVKKFSKNKMA